MFIDMEVARKDLEAALDGPGPNWIDEFEKEFRGRFKYQPLNILSTAAMRMACANFANNKYLLNVSASGDLTNEK